MLLLGCAAAARAQYEVCAIRYATIRGFPVAGLVQGADKSRKLDIAMMVWLVRGHGHNVLVDSGFYRPQFLEKWKPADFLRPDEAVARAGVHANEVTDLVITHFHWDHADGADLFPKAQVWIQKEEYEHYAKDLTNLDAAKAEGRLHLVEGDREILPGIGVYTGGKHTFASQYVVVGDIVLASDNVYLYENLEKHVPIAQTVDAASNLAAQDRMKTLGTVIVPGHDPEVMTRFPKVNDRVVRITPVDDDFRVSVEWWRGDKRSTAVIYGSGAGVRDGERAFRLPRTTVAEIEKMLRDAKFDEMPARFGEAESDFLRMRGKIVAGSGGRGHSVVQLVDGPQSDELATLAAAILAKASAAGGVTATSLNDGLAKIAAGEIAPQTLHVELQRRGGEGFSMQLRGDDVFVRPFAEKSGYGAPKRLRLSEDEVKKLALLMRDADHLAANVNAPDYTDFRVDVLNHAKEVQGRPQFQLLRRDFNGIVDALVAIAKRALTSGEAATFVE